MEDYGRIAGRLLREERKPKGITAEYVAQKLDVDRSTVTHWETGRRAMTVDQFFLYCNVIKADPVELTKKIVKAIPPQEDEEPEVNNGLEIKEMKQYGEIIGKILRSERNNKGVTAQYIANILGCARSEVTYWETNKRSISAEELFQYCDILGLDAVEVTKRIVNGE